MRFWRCLQTIVVLAATLASASPTPQAAGGETGVDGTSDVNARAAAEAKAELQQAAAVLASMPTCGVSWIGGISYRLDNQLTVLPTA